LLKRHAEEITLVEATIPCESVDFAEAIEAVESLVATDVEASVWGLGEGAAPVADVSGVLRRMPERDLAGEPIDAEVAVTSCVGEPESGHLTLWPSRFIAAERDLQHVIEITTQDGVRIGPRSRPWID
jgi:hypothetical protein